MAALLDEIEAIRQLKYAYFRLLDLKRFEALGELLTAGCTASYEDGRQVLDGRAAIVRFLTESLADPGIVTLHQGHHPEIVLVDTGPADRGEGVPAGSGEAGSPGSDSDDGLAATGTWYLQDRVILPSADLEIGGTAIYRDEYVKSGGRWRIAHTGYERIFEERRTHSTLALQAFRSRF